MTKDEFKQIVKLIGKFPSNLDIILKSAGYDCLYTISQIDEDDIKLIEEYTTNHPVPVVGTEYCLDINNLTDDFRFQFKPGHKKFIIRLASQ